MFCTVLPFVIKADRCVPQMFNRQPATVIDFLFFRMVRSSRVFSNDDMFPLLTRDFCVSCERTRVLSAS